MGYFVSDVSTMMDELTARRSTRPPHELDIRLEAISAGPGARAVAAPLQQGDRELAATELAGAEHPDLAPAEDLRASHHEQLRGPHEQRA